jgi:hypothetical protein
LFLALAVLFATLLWSGCSLPKYTTVNSEQPPDYYLGESPEVSVVNAEGATRRMQDIAIQELRTQSRSNGHFTIENRLDEGVRFDVRQRKMVMTGKDVSVSSDDVFVKFNVVASMKQDGRTTITRQTGVLGTETEEVPAVVTVMPVTFTVAKGEEVLLSERQYDGRAVWPIGQGGGDYPPRQQRFEAAIGKAVDRFSKTLPPVLLAAGFASTTPTRIKSPFWMSPATDRSSRQRRRWRSTRRSIQTPRRHTTTWPY